MTRLAMASTAFPLQRVDLGPVIASRRLWRQPRLLCQIEPDLSQLIDGVEPDISALGTEGAGYRFQSVSQAMADRLPDELPGLLPGARQDFPRYYVDLRPGFDAYMAQFSGKTRSTLRRKARKLAAHDGGALDIRSFHRPEEIDAFFQAALPLSARTYQDRLLDAGLPDDPQFRRKAEALARADAVRAWVLFVHGAAAAYLYLPVTGRTLRYDYLGYDPALANLSVGTVLQMHALEQVMAEKRCDWFDFTSGDGAHKRLFATGHVDCSTIILLRPGLANRAALLSEQIIDRAAQHGAGWAKRWGLDARLRKALRR